MQASVRSCIASTSSLSHLLLPRSVSSLAQEATAARRASIRQKKSRLPRRLAAPRSPLLHARTYATNESKRALRDAAASASEPPLSIPGNIPREDYATPAMYSLGIMGRLFRYSIYGSVAIVVGGATLYLSLHAYVEYYALRPSYSSDQADIEAFLPEERLPAYSGAHLGGGTDPSLGWRSRFAARGAWIAQNFSSGGVVPGSSGRSKEFAVPDSAWLQAERLLAYALSHAHASSSSQAKQELLALLADVRSRLAGPRGLGDARRSYLQMIMAASEGASEQDKARALFAEAKLAEVDLRIAQELIQGSRSAEEVAAYRSNASKRLNRALSSASGMQQPLERQPIEAVQLGETASVAARTPEPGVMSWFGLSTQQPSTPPTPVTSVSSVDDTLSESLSQLAPVTQRATASAMLTLAGVQATTGDLVSTERTLQFVSRALQRILGEADKGRKLDDRERWLSSRLAQALNGLGEIAYASPKDPESKTKGDQYIQQASLLCHSILENAERQSSTQLPPHRQEIYRSAVMSAVTGLRTRGMVREVQETDSAAALADYEEALALLDQSAHNAALGILTEARSRLLVDVRRCREAIKRKNLV